MMPMPPEDPRDSEDPPSSPGKPLPESQALPGKQPVEQVGGDVRGQEQSDAPGAYFAGSHDDFGLTPQPRAKMQRVDPLLGIDLGGVKIVKLIGEGGMGRVYEAEQTNPRRTVAVKVVRQGITSEKTMRRFEREAQILGKLQHPHIAQIHVVGSYSSDIGDLPFFVMEFVANAKPITNFAAERDLSLEEKLRLFKRVCEAVSHGHDRGVVHRDLKPGNILIDATGSPKIIDFGVARSTDSDLTLTSMKTDTGQLVGTVQYMSPEQFGDGPDDLDGRADVYSLGVVLYELVGGVLPYEVRKKKMHEAARIVCEQIPTPLKALERTIPRPVSLIAERSLQKNRRDRYQSAGALASDIERYLDGRPISQSMRGRVARMRNTAQHLTRGRAARITIAAAMVLAAIGGTLLVDRAYRKTPGGTPGTPAQPGAGQATAADPDSAKPSAGSATRTGLEPNNQPRTQNQPWIVGSWLGEIAGNAWSLEFQANGKFTERVSGNDIDNGTWQMMPGNLAEARSGRGTSLMCQPVDGLLEVTRESNSGIFNSTHVFRRVKPESADPAQGTLRQDLLAVAEEAASASTAHDLPRLLNLMSREIPNRDLFVSQCRKEWALTGLHYRLDGLEVLDRPDWEFPYAVAMVTLTIRDLSQDRDTRPPLPDDPLSHKMQLRTRVPTTRCEWLFKHEDEAWKIVANLTEPEAVRPAK
jgi:serine/threonine protein kinase